MQKHREFLFAAVLLLTALCLVGCPPSPAPPPDAAPAAPTEEVVGAATAPSSEATPGAERPVLFKEVTVRDLNLADVQPVDDPTVARQRFVILDSARMRSTVLDPSADGLPPGPIILNLFEDVEVTLVTKSIDQVAPGTMNWVGVVGEDDLGSAAFVLKDNNITGNVVVDGTLYQVSPVGTGEMQSIVEIDQSGFPEEGNPDIPELPNYRSADFDRSSMDLLEQEPAIIDVMVLYTPQARSAIQDIETEIQLAVLGANLSYENSGIVQRLRLVHTQEVQYSDSGDLRLDRNRLQTPDDGFMDEVHALRDEHGADVVSLWVEGGNACGWAYLMDRVTDQFAPYGFCVVRRDCARGYYSFAHELGHLMGARHDWFVDPTVDSPFSHNHAHINVDDGWRTIMAYNDACDCSDEVSPCPPRLMRATPDEPNCTRLQYWSNPDENYNGDPLGQPLAAPKPCDNHLTLNKTGLTVALFGSLTQATGRPDLVVDAISVDNTAIVQGEEPPTWLRYRISNIGTADTPAGEITVRNWVNGSPRPGQIVIEGSIPAGGSIERSFVVGHDEAWPVGKYSMQLEVDYQSSVDEDDEANNFSAFVDFAVARSRLAYVHGNNTAAAGSYKELLESNGYLVDLVAMDDVLATGFQDYAGLLIGGDTGRLSSWGDSAGGQVSHIQEANRPILGLGEGGYAFFGRLGLEVGWGKGWHGDGRDIQVVDGENPVWHTPGPIPVPSTEAVQLYAADVSCVAIHYPSPLPSVTALGRQVDDSTHYPLIGQDDRFLLWGFGGTPAAMTPEGQSVFLNVVDNLLSADLFSEATGPAETPDLLESIAPRDCLPYNPANLRIADEGARGWLLTDGVSRMSMLDDEIDARIALTVARHHTAHCFIGRGNSRPDRIDYIVEYWTGGTGSLPAIDGEDCLPYNPASLRVIDEGANGWLLTDGSSRMLMLDDEQDAQNALLLARSFSQHCFVGRDNNRPNRKSYIFEYWK